MTEPSTAQVLLSIFLGAPAAIVVLVGLIYYIAEEFRTRRKPTKNDWAYGKERECGIKFITKDYHK